MKDAKKKKTIAQVVKKDARSLTEEPIAGLAVDVYRLYDEETGNSVLVSLMPKELEEGVERHGADVGRAIGGLHVMFHDVNVCLAEGDEFFFDNLSFRKATTEEAEEFPGFAGTIDVLVRRKKR